MKLTLLLLTVMSVTVAFAGPKKPVKPRAAVTRTTVSVGQKTTPPETGGIKLVNGFQASVFAENLGKARHIVVDQVGTVFVKLEKLNDGKGIVELNDTNGDGKADQTVMFGNYTGTGMALYNDYLYASSDTSVYRYKLTNGKVMETTPAEPIITGLTLQRQHASKSLAISPDGKLFVNFGAPSNACQEKDRQKGSVGMDPCPILDEYGGIWLFDANKLNQHKADGKRYATGIRNAVSLDWNTANNTLYALQHGRDNLNNWGGVFTDEVSAELPSEEFLMVKEGNDFGWPYCYNNHVKNQKLLAPEYGGDGTKVDRCAGKEKPIMAFPGHWAPNDLLFYTGSAFPARYKNGAFVCFPRLLEPRAPQAGRLLRSLYSVWKRWPSVGQIRSVRGKLCGVPEQGTPGTGANAGKLDLDSPGDAKARPVGLAQGPDGSLYITDSVKGNVWRVTYTAKKS